MQIPFLTEVQNGRLICEENGRILVKECLVLSLFLEVKSLVCYLIVLYSDFHRKFRIFQFCICAIRMHIPIPTGVQNGRVSC